MVYELSLLSLHFPRHSDRAYVFFVRPDVTDMPLAELPFKVLLVAVCLGSETYRAWFPSHVFP